MILIGYYFTVLDRSFGSRLRARDQREEEKEVVFPPVPPHSHYLCKTGEPGEK
jgi:hypothetical protein